MWHFDFEVGKCSVCAYLINAGGMSLFMIWSSVVCTVSFPTCKKWVKVFTSFTINIYNEHSKVFGHLWNRITKWHTTSFIYCRIWNWPVSICKPMWNSFVLESGCFCCLSSNLTSHTYNMFWLILSQEDRGTESSGRGHNQTYSVAM